MEDLNKKLGTPKQLRSVYEIEFTANRERGKRALLIHNNGMELLVSLDNAMDIVWVKFNGVNVSFLSKNGLNGNEGAFENRFEGGFLYTCGLDNISTCVDGKPVHGSLHYQKAEDVSYRCEGDKVYVKGRVYSTALFKENLALDRTLIIGESSVEVEDVVRNLGYREEGIVLLYHTNFGYPMLDEGCRVEAEFDSVEGLTEKARSHIDRFNVICASKDDDPEEVFYCKPKKGEVRLVNESLGLTAKIIYNKEEIPELLIWKSMSSGDYALGLEPSTSRFDRFQTVKLPKQTSKTYRLRYEFLQLD